jgi:hypothetical protein
MRAAGGGRGLTRPPTVAATSVHAQRLAAQLLAGPPARDPPAVAERLLAIQAQDPRGARLAIRARLGADPPPAAADIDRELTDRRSLLITWCNRGTLHLIRSEDYPLLQALTTPPLRTAVARRLAQEGVSDEQAARGVRLIDAALADAGPLSRPQLRERLEREGVPVAGQALVHLLVRASIDGLIVRGPMRGREHAFVRVRDWLEPVPPVDRDVALAELARRYLAGHGPASDRDLARWAGITLGDARAGLTAIAGRLAIRQQDGLVRLARAPGGGGADASPSPPAPRLLGAFEPVLMGWTSRSGVLAEHESRVVAGGIFRSFALVDGRAAAGWRFAGPRGERIELEPWAPLPAGVLSALQADATAVTEFLRGAIAET